MQVILKNITKVIWKTNIKSQPLWKRIIITVCRFVYLIINDLANGQLNLRAMSLVFTTILSFVPLIAVSFSVLKAFGVHNQIEPALLNLFSHLGDKAPELTNNIIGFVDNVEVGLLGVLGIAFLFYSVISLLTKVEEAFNYTWRIHKTRSLTERFSSYLSVLMVGPVLVLLAMGTTATLLNNAVTQSLASVEPFGVLLEFVAKLIPYVLIICAFTFAYLFVPNTKVRFIPALMGGLIAGILWQTVGYFYALIIAQSSTQTAIYAGFAIIFFFMTWLYLNWLILLVGSSVAFYRQYPEYLMAKNQSVSLNNHDREHIALNVLLMIGANFYNKNVPVSVESIVDYLSCPKQSVEEVLLCYEEAGILHSVGVSSSSYLPATPLENLTVSEAYLAIRSSYAIFSPVQMYNADTDMALPIINRVESSIERELGDLTIKQVLEMNAIKAENLNMAMAES
mgnify:CR=1 FL=1|tara:strand:- start:114 stop:1472 length:1359 start_codon:yes stop_codon:yes gene_type:complete